MKRDVPVVSYRNSTSNHNRAPNHLYLQEVVSYRNSTSNHNAGAVQSTFQRLYLIEILHQTTTPALFKVLSSGCILSKFYIKPQLRVPTTANIMRCILSKFYIKPQLYSYAWPGSTVVSYRNSTSNHNTAVRLFRAPCVVSYRNSTSNHNSHDETGNFFRLYLIEILHQTTTTIERN